MLETYFEIICVILTLSRRRPISYRNQSIHLLCKSIDWFLYDIGLRRERVKIKKGMLKSVRYMYRSSHSQMFFKIAFLKNLANFTGKHLC